MHSATLLANCYSEAGNLPRCSRQTLLFTDISKWFRAPRGLDHIKGRQDLDVLPADFRTFLADTQKAFNHSFTLAEAPMAELGRALVPYLDYLDSREECAHAFESEGYHFIGISIPMVERLRDSAERLLRTEQVVALLSIPAGYVNRHNAIGGILTIKFLFITAHEFGHHLWGHASDFRLRVGTVSRIPAETGHWNNRRRRTSPTVTPLISRSAR